MTELVTMTVREMLHEFLEKLAPESLNLRVRAGVFMFPVVHEDVMNEPNPFSLFHTGLDDAQIFMILDLFWKNYKKKLEIKP